MPHLLWWTCITIILWKSTLLQIFFWYYQIICVEEYSDNIISADVGNCGIVKKWDFSAFPLLFPVCMSNILLYSLPYHNQRERERDFWYKFWQVTAQSYWSLKKTKFYPKKVYQRRCLNPLRVFVVDGSGFTSFKFELKYMAFFFLVGRNESS